MTAHGTERPEGTRRRAGWWRAGVLARPGGPRLPAPGGRTVRLPFPPRPCRTCEPDRPRRPEGLLTAAGPRRAPTPALPRPARRPSVAAVRVHGAGPGSRGGGRRVCHRHQEWGGIGERASRGPPAGSSPAVRRLVACGTSFRPRPRPVSAGGPAGRTRDGRRVEVVADVGRGPRSACSATGSSSGRSSR